MALIHLSSNNMQLIIFIKKSTWSFQITPIDYDLD